MPPNFMFCVEHERAELLKVEGKVQGSLTALQTSAGCSLHLLIFRTGPVTESPMLSFSRSASLTPHWLPVSARKSQLTTDSFLGHPRKAHALKCADLFIVIWTTWKSQFSIWVWVPNSGHQAWWQMSLPFKPS